MADDQDYRRPSAVLIDLLRLHLHQRRIQAQSTTSQTKPLEQLNLESSPIIKADAFSPVILRKRDRSTSLRDTAGRSGGFFSSYNIANSQKSANELVFTRDHNDFKSPDQPNNEIISNSLQGTKEDKENAALTQVLQLLNNESLMIDDDSDDKDTLCYTRNYMNHKFNSYFDLEINRYSSDNSTSKSSCPGTVFLSEPSSPSKVSDTIASSISLPQSAEFSTMPFFSFRKASRKASRRLVSAKRNDSSSSTSTYETSCDSSFSVNTVGTESMKRMVLATRKEYFNQAREPLTGVTRSLQRRQKKPGLSIEIPEQPFTPPSNTRDSLITPNYPLSQALHDSVLQAYQGLERKYHLRTVQIIEKDDVDSNTGAQEIDQDPEESPRHRRYRNRRAQIFEMIESPKQCVRRRRQPSPDIVVQKSIPIERAVSPPFERIAFRDRTDIPRLIVPPARWSPHTK